MCQQGKRYNRLPLSHFYEARGFPVNIPWPETEGGGILRSITRQPTGFFLARRPRLSLSSTAGCISKPAQQHLQHLLKCDEVNGTLWAARTNQNHSSKYTNDSLYIATTKDTAARSK